MRPIPSRLRCETLFTLVKIQSNQWGRRNLRHGISGCWDIPLQKGTAAEEILQRLDRCIVVGVNQVMLDGWHGLIEWHMKLEKSLAGFFCGIRSSFFFFNLSSLATSLLYTLEKNPSFYCSHVTATMQLILSWQNSSWALPKVVSCPCKKTFLVGRWEQQASFFTRQNLPKTVAKL